MPIPNSTNWPIAAASPCSWSNVPTTPRNWRPSHGSDGTQAPTAGRTSCLGWPRRVRPATRSWPWGIAHPSLPPGVAEPSLGSRRGPRGAPATCFVGFGGQAGPATVNQVPCTFSFDLNTGTVTFGGSFPDLPSSLEFTVEFAHRFDGSGGENMLFH